MVRSARKLLRYLHRIYMDMGFRNELYSFEWLCINGLAFSFPLEYLVSVILVLVTFPVARHAESMSLKLGSCNIDLSLSYLILLFTSLPYFLGTLVYLCRKREQIIASKQRTQDRRRGGSRRAQVSKQSDESEDEE